VSVGCFPEALLTKLTLLRCNISIFAGPNKKMKSKIRAKTLDCCEGVWLSGKRYISFWFPAFQKKVVAKEEGIKRLSEGQNKLCQPNSKE
jgi:hypothetical protein